MNSFIHPSVGEIVIPVLFYKDDVEIKQPLKGDKIFKKKKASQGHVLVPG